MIATLFTIIPLVTGLVLLAAAGWEFYSWRRKFAKWGKRTAKAIGERNAKGDVGPKLIYEFEVDGRRVEGVSGYMNDRLPAPGTAVTVYYNPEDPSQSEWYSAGMHNFLMAGVGALGLLLVWASL